MEEKKGLPDLTGRMERFKIVYNDTVFKDVNEFVRDMGNVFAQMFQVIKDNKRDLDLADEEKRKETAARMAGLLEPLKQELLKRLAYITDTERVSENLTAALRPKLLQFKALADSMDFARDQEEKTDSLADFYYKRILEEKVVVKGKILGRPADEGL